MKRLFFAPLLSVIAMVPGVSSGVTTDSGVPQGLQASIGQVQLRLEARDGMCNAVAVNSPGTTTRYALGIPWPCQFHLDKAGAIRTIPQADFTYVLLESSRRRAEGSSDCETHLQAIRVKGTAIEVSQHQERVASCPPFQWDNMLFKELFD